MNVEQLKELCKKGGEKKTVEYKTTTGEIRSAVGTVCAFLNNKGGIVLIGVHDHGKISGQFVSDNTRKEIATEIAKIEPHANVVVEYIDVGDGKYVIVLQVEPGKYAPYTYDGRPYHREESKTDRMSQHRYEQLIVERSQLNHSWEEFVADDYSLDDLEQEEIYKTVADGIQENRIPASAQRENAKEILTRLNLISDNKLKRAAVVLYSKQEALKFPQCTIKMARFKGINKLGDFIDNQQVSGNAFKLLSEADSFLRRHLPVASFFRTDQFKRVDKPILPIMAVREALVNAICHRDYSDRETDFSLGIYDDRLEIWNSGLLLKKLTTDDLRHNHESILRNRFIANAFYVRGYIEKWGSGTIKMIDLCRQNDIPEPEFIVRTGGIAVILRFKEPIGGKKISLPNQILTIRQQEILKLIENNAMNATQIAEKLQNSPTIRTVQKDLSHLEDLGFVKRTGKARGVIWAVVKTK